MQATTSAPPPPRRRPSLAPAPPTLDAITGGIVEDGTYAKLSMRKERLGDWYDHPKNPRIHGDPGSPEWLKLEASLVNAYFDPIVGNVRNGMLVSGHFRKKVLISKGVIFADMSLVDVDEDTHLAMLLAANEGAGKDDKLKKKALLVDLSSDSKKHLLMLTGVRDTEMRRMMLTKEAPVEATYDITARIGEKHDYIMIFCDNETDWAFLRQLFEIKREKSYKNTAIGIGRAVPFRRAMASIAKNIDSVKSQVVTE